jgi:hypothetical protein
MPLTQQEIGEISTDVIRSYPNRPVEFVAVMATEGGSGRVEVMLTVKGCHAQPCNLVFNLPRQDKPSFERALRRRLERTLRDHLGASRS